MHVSLTLVPTCSTFTSHNIMHDLHVALHLYLNYILHFVGKQVENWSVLIKLLSRFVSWSIS